jgi:hypothetical protein
VSNSFTENDKESDGIFSNNYFEDNSYLENITAEHFGDDQIASSIGGTSDDNLVTELIIRLDKGAVLAEVSVSWRRTLSWEDEGRCAKKSSEAPEDNYEHKEMVK